MAPKKPPSNGSLSKPNGALSADRDDEERIRQAAEEALWVESAEEWVKKADKMYAVSTGESQEDVDQEGEGEESDGLDEENQTSQHAPDTHEIMTLKLVSELAQEELKDPESFPPLHPELGIEVPQDGGLEWKCVYGRKGAKYEGTLNVYRAQDYAGMNQPMGSPPDSEEDAIRVPNKYCSSMVYTFVSREYIQGRGVHQDLHGDQYAGEWWGGVRQGHGTQTWINREHIKTVGDVDFYNSDLDETDEEGDTEDVINELKDGDTPFHKRHPFYTGKKAFAYLHDKVEEPGWIRPEDGELRGKHGAFPDVYQWTTADNLVGTYSGQWYRDSPEGCGVFVWSDGTSLAGEWRRGQYIGNFPVCTYQESDFHMRLGQLAAQKAKMFQYKPQDMTVIHEKPHLWQHPYFYDDGDQWRAPGPIHKFYEVPPEYRARVERMDAEREAWLDGWKNAGKEHPDWQQQWTAIEAVEQQQLVQVNFGEPSPLMEIAEQAGKTDHDNVHEQLRLSAAARGAIIPSVRELRELASGRQLGPGQLLMLLAEGKAPPLVMEDIEATVQFVDKYGEEGLIGVDDQMENGRTRPMTVERARELLLEAIPDTLLRESRQRFEAAKTLEPPPVNLLRLETQPMRAAPDRDSPEYAQRVKERVLRRSEEALQELNDQLQAALRLKRLPGLPLVLDDAQRDYLRKVKDEYQLRLNTIRERRLRAVAVEEVAASEGNMGGLDLSDVERKARLEYLQAGRERALLPGDEEVVGGQGPKGWQEKADRALIQGMTDREGDPEGALVLRGMPLDELKRTQKHAQRFYNLELEATEKLLEFSRLLENYSRVPNDAPLEKPSPARPPLLPAHPPGHISNPLPPVNTPAEAAEAIMSTASKAGHAPLQGVSRFLGILPLADWFRLPFSPTPVEAYAEYLEELPVRSKLEWTADAAPRVAVGPGGEVIEAEDNLEYQDSLERLRAEHAQLAEDIRREQDDLLAEEASTYVANVVDLARREAAELQATKLDSRFWGDQADKDKNQPIYEWEPRPIWKTEEELAAESRSIRDEIQRRVEAARAAEEDAEFDATFTHEENQERLELREALERKKAAMDPSARLDKMLAESTYSQPGALVELEMAMEEEHIGALLPVPAAPGAESYSDRVEETFRELQDMELDRARDAAQKAKERLTADEGEEEEDDDEAALVADARAQIEGPEEEEDSVKRLERLEQKIMDLKWERVVKEDREAHKAFQLLGVTYEPLVLAHKRLISGLRNRELALDARLEAALTDFFAQWEAQYGPNEPEQARIFDTWLAKWVATEERLDAEPFQQLAARAQQPQGVRVDELLLQDQATPPLLKGFLAKLAELEKQRNAEAEQEQRAWEEGRVLALPAPNEAPPRPPRQEVPALELHDGLDAVDVAQRRARELLAELQMERVEAEVTRQLRAEIAARDGGWDLIKAAKALRTLGSERRRKRAEEWDAVVRDAFENGTLDKYPLLVQLERAAQEELGLHGELPRGHILWAPLLRPRAPFLAGGLTGSPTLPLPFRIGKENLLARLRSDPESPLYDGSSPSDPIFKDGAAAWDLAADAYSGVHRPDSIVQSGDSGAVSGSTEWEVAEQKGIKWLGELQASILDSEAPGWREQAAQAAQRGAPLSGVGAEAGLEVLAEHPLFDLQVTPAGFKEQLAARLVVAQMTGRVFDMLGMKLAPGADQAEYVFAPKTRAPDEVADAGEEASIWDDPDEPEWTPELSIYTRSDAVRGLVASQVKQLARSVPAPSELPPPGSSLNFEAAVEQRKQQVLKNLVKDHLPRSYEKLPQQLKDVPESWLPGENEFTATEEEVNRFIDSVRDPKNLETLVASLRRVVAAQDEFAQIVERGKALTSSAEQRFVKEFLVPKTVELSRLENKLWKEGLLLANEQPELVAFWKAEWDAREAFQRGAAAVMAQPAFKRAEEERKKTEDELDSWYDRADKTLSEAAWRKANDRATLESRLSGEEYAAPEVDYNGRPVLTGAPEEVGANPEEEFELAYEEMEQRDMNTALYNRRDELDEEFFQDGLRKARDAIRKLGGTAAFSEDLANFTRTLFKTDLELAKELLGPEDEQADGHNAGNEDAEYEEVEVEVDDDDEDAYPAEEGDFWEAVRTQLQGTSPADLDKKEAEQKPREWTLKDVLPDAIESRITAEVEAERPSKDKAVLWNMTEDDETKLDVFSVAPDGKFSKYDEQERAFLPYADLDALVVNPAAVKPRPGSPEEEALLAAEAEAKRAAEQERLRRGGDDVIPTDALEVDEYGYAVVKSGVEEEEEEERATGQQWRRQPWYSNESFFDYLEVPKAEPELTLDHEKEFLLQGVWAAAAKTPWIGDEGEIVDPATKKARVDAALDAANKSRAKRLQWASKHNPHDDKLEALLSDDVDDVERDTLEWFTYKAPEGKSFLIGRDADGQLVCKDIPPPETREERRMRLRREAAEMGREVLDEEADDRWARLLRREEEAAAEIPPDGCFCQSDIGNDDEQDIDADVDVDDDEDDLEEDEVVDAGDDDEDRDERGDGMTAAQREEAAELQEAIRKINAGEFVPPRMPAFLRNLLRKKPGRNAPPPPVQESASLTLGALRVLPSYTDAVRWVSAKMQPEPLCAAKRIPKRPAQSKRSKIASRGKRACPVDKGCFSLAVPLGKWAHPEEI